MILDTSIEIESFDRIFAIGDVHGCFDQLNTLYSFLVSNRKLSKDDIVIFLGDYIDRGPKQVETLDFLCKLKDENLNIIFLKGNHEDMFLDFIGLDGQYGNMSFANGSEKLFKEYNLSQYIGQNLNREARWCQITKEEVRERIPKKHLDFIKNLELSVETDKLLFVHAGINPIYTDISYQTMFDLLWIREEFYNYISSYPIGKTIIYGHTPFQKVCFNLPHFIAIDTGCFRNGNLSCLEIVDENELNKSISITVNSEMKIILNDINFLRNKE